MKLKNLSLILATIFLISCTNSNEIELNKKMAGDFLEFSFIRKSKVSSTSHSC